MSHDCHIAHSYLYSHLFQTPPNGGFPSYTKGHLVCHKLQIEFQLKVSGTSLLSPILFVYRSPASSLAHWPFHCDTTYHLETLAWRGACCDPVPFSADVLSEDKQAEPEGLCFVFSCQAKWYITQLFIQVQKRWSRDENGQQNDLLHANGNSTYSRWNKIKNCQRGWCCLRCFVFSVNTWSSQNWRRQSSRLQCLWFHPTKA